MHAEAQKDEPRSGLPLKGIEDLIARLPVAWNSRDAAKYASAFAEDADFVNVLGMHWKGRTEIERMHAMLFRTIMSKTHLQMTSHSIRMLSDSIALAHVNWEMEGTEKIEGWKLPDKRHGVLSCVLIERNQEWLIASLHNTDTVPVKMPPDK